jgi:hypothetical protein
VEEEEEEEEEERAPGTDERKTAGETGSNSTRRTVATDSTTKYQPDVEVGGRAGFFPPGQKLRGQPTSLKRVSSVRGPKKHILTQ